MTMIELIAATIGLVAFIVAAGWLLFHAAIIGDEQRKRQEDRE